MSQENEQVHNSEGLELLILLWVTLAMVWVAILLFFVPGGALYGGDLLLGDLWMSIPPLGMSIVGVAMFVWGIKVNSTWGVPFGAVATLLPLIVWWFLYSLANFPIG